MAPNFSKFYEDALKEGLGLVEFIELHHPGEADLKEIKPKMDMPYKGYFPSGKICKVFGKEFNDWSRSFTARTRGEKNKKMLEFFITRVKTTTGLSLTKADLIVSGSGSAPGSNAGGGYSWIHPRLMTHFLQWCCPDFAEEVLDVFQRYLSADPSIVAESTSLHNASLQQRLQAAEDDKLQQQELLEQSVSMYEAAITTIALAKQEIASKRDELVQELELIKAQDREKYEAMVCYHDAKEEELQAHLHQLQQDNDDLEAGKRKLEDQMDSDSGRPLNVFKKARVSISAVNRNNTFYFWFPARHITIDAAIYFARKNYMYYAQLVTAAAVNDCFFADKAIAASLTQLTADSKQVVKGERHLLNNKFHELPANVSNAIVLKLFSALEDQLKEVFGVRIYYEDFNMYMAINNIKLYQVLCKRLKKIYDVDFSTQIDAKFLAKMAYNFNQYTLGEFKIPLDTDYDEFDEETLQDVQLRD